MDSAGFQFAHPLWLTVLPAILVIYAFLSVRLLNRRSDGLKVAALGPIKSARVHRRNVLNAMKARLGSLLLVLAVSCLSIALARPQMISKNGTSTREGLDIMLIVDVSLSMNALDFAGQGSDAQWSKRLRGHLENIQNGSTRLDAIKQVLDSFVAKRSDDRIGLVIFGSEARTSVPMTTDHAMLREAIINLRVGSAGDGTAIGDGLATALRRFQTTSTATKQPIAILLTDGASNSGRIEPATAAQAAKALGIKVYTVGVGSDGEAPIVIRGQLMNMKLDLDEKLMTEIATTSGGKYFRAKDLDKLQAVYDTIDQLEKTEFKDQPPQILEEFWPQLITMTLVLCGVYVLWLLSPWRELRLKPEEIAA